jgi:tetratricopeptide (TPR) repeat protein
MQPYLLIFLVGLVYILGFDALSILRRQGVSTRFALESLGVTVVFAVLSFIAPIPVVIFLIALYLITMRVRILVDLGSWLTSRKRFDQALNIYRLALRLWADDITRQIVLINKGVTQLRMDDPEAAYVTLEEAMADEQIRPAAKYQSAGYYNLGLACRRTGREADAIRRFNEAIDTLPNSIYAHGARQALKEGRADKTQET